MLSHRLKQLADAAHKQQGADRDCWYAVTALAIGADPNRPARVRERALGPAQCDVDDVAAIAIEGTNALNLLPCNRSWQQASIGDAASINREHRGCAGGAPGKRVQQPANADEPGQAQPVHDQIPRHGAGQDSGCAGGKEGEAGQAYLSQAPEEVPCLAAGLRCGHTGLGGCDAGHAGLPSALATAPASWASGCSRIIRKYKMAGDHSVTAAGRQAS